MSQYTTVVKVKDASETQLGRKVIVYGAEGGPSGLGGSLRASVEASNNPDVERVYETACERYDPDEYEGETVLARVHPDGDIEWPLEDESARGGTRK